MNRRLRRQAKRGSKERIDDQPLFGVAEPVNEVPKRLTRAGLAMSHATSHHPAARTGAQVSRHLSPALVTAVYDSFWFFAAERQRVFFRRARAEAPPWTEDRVIATYKFTNAYRASDRVSQFLIRHVIYRDDLPRSPREICFRILLFKFFNRIETWTLLEDSLGPITFKDFQFNRYDAVLSAAMREGQKIYSAAYIMPPGGNAFGHSAKHQNHLRLIEHMIRTNLPERIAEARSMQRAFELLRAYPTVGDFLAYQFVTDINYSEVTNFSEVEFTVAGPGALDGISKCFISTGGLHPAELIRLMADRQEAEFDRLGIVFPALWGRRLQLIDCQNLFCEISKYARVAHPDVSGAAGRTRIKQKFEPNPIPIPYWYPPKWGINDDMLIDLAIGQNRPVASQAISSSRG